MNVEYTGRQYEIPPSIRKEVETGLNKIRKILGDRFETKVILAVEKHRHKAEITINPPNGPIVGLAQAHDMVSAVNDALDHLHKQALKYKTKWLKQVSAKHVKNSTATARARILKRNCGLTDSATVSVTVHRFPSRGQDDRVHLVRSADSVALRPMTLEEAIKEAHFRDRDVFVFRDPKGKLMVLHRTRDGKMELIEAP